MWDLFALTEVNRTWFLIPLAVVISLVYSASRFEAPGLILRRAARLCLQIMVCLGGVFAVLAWLSWAQ